MGSYKRQAGRSGSTPDKGVTEDAERKKMLRGGPEGTETGGKLETGKFHQNIILQPPEQTKGLERLKRSLE